MINYTKVTTLILHIEKYTNAGLKQRDIINALKKISNIIGIRYVKPSSINSNIEIALKNNVKDYAYDVILSDIEYTLELMLKALKSK